MEHHGRSRAGRHLALSVAYVGSAGRRLPSSIDPINAIDLSYLSMGNALYDEFAPGQTSLDGVPLPYAGWVEQMTGCAPVGRAGAAALSAVLRQPAGPQREPRRVALQLAADEAREALLGRHLRARVVHAVQDESTAARTTRSGTRITWSGAHGVISPFEPERNEAISLHDTPHVLSAAFVYELPFGPGKKHLANRGRPRRMRCSAGGRSARSSATRPALPIFFRVNGTACNVPGQFRAACIPAIVNPDAVFAQDKGSFDPANGPLLNINAFEPVSAFNFYTGRGNRIEETVRGFAYHNQDVSLVKNTRLPGNTNVQFAIRDLQPMELAHLLCDGSASSRPQRSIRTSRARISVHGRAR